MEIAFWIIVSIIMCLIMTNYSFHNRTLRKLNKAQAETIRIQAEAINSQGGTDYVALQAIKQWNGVLPVQMIPGGTVPFINLTK